MGVGGRGEGLKGRRGEGLKLGGEESVFKGVGLKKKEGCF